MKLGNGPRGEVGTLTPTLSRKREREHFSERKGEHLSFSPGNGGEGWGEGAPQIAAAELRRY
jgi:hypothetical protein